MEINIITQPLFCNYGGILQNYALQETLRRMGHEVMTVNVPPRAPAPRPDWRCYAHSMINFFRKLQGNYYSPFLNPHTCAVKERELSSPQRAFIEKYIDKEDCEVPFNKETVHKYPADLWIVGSDQVWRPWCSPDIGNYFFDFLEDDTPRIAYAASFGTDQWEISPEMTPGIRELARKFTTISVREKSGLELCRKFLGVEACHVLDPTMLLTADDYLALTSRSDYPAGDYIATYILDPDKEKMLTIKAESQRLNIPVVPVGQMHRHHFDTIESWLATISHAKYILTDSFHGTVFSIIFRRPVKILKNEMRGNSRLDSLLDIFRLSPQANGYIEMDEISVKEFNAFKKKSLDFLSNSIS